MGTDIHLVAEVFDDGDWKPIPNPVRPCWLCIDHPGLYQSWREQKPHTMVACPRCTADENEATKYPPFHTPEAWFWERDYTLFSLLADVRNDYEPRITPLNFKYGIPDDLSWEHTNWMSQHDHTPTHIDVRELVQHDWTEQQQWVKDRIKELVAITGERPARLVYWFDS